MLCNWVNRKQDFLTGVWRRLKAVERWLPRWRVIMTSLTAHICKDYQIQNSFICYALNTFSVWTMFFIICLTV